MPQDDYDASCVGRKALHLQELRNMLQHAGLEVENSVSLPFGAVKQLLEGHYENAAQNRHACKVQQSIDELMDDHADGSEGATAQSEKVNRQLFEARCDLSTGSSRTLPALPQYPQLAIAPTATTPHGSSQTATVNDAVQACHAWNHAARARQDRAGGGVPGGADAHADERPGLEAAGAADR